MCNEKQAALEAEFNQQKEEFISFYSNYWKDNPHFLCAALADYYREDLFTIKLRQCIKAYVVEGTLKPILTELYGEYDDDAAECAERRIKWMQEHVNFS